MKKTCLLALLALTVALTTAYAEPLELHFVFEDKPSFPYYLGTGEQVDEDKPGVSVEMMKKLEQMLDVRIIFDRKPWKRCLTNLETGLYEGLFDASFKPERLQFGLYPMKDGQVDVSRHTVTMAYCLYKLRGMPVIWDPEKNEIRGLVGSVGAPLGYSIVADLKEKWHVPVDESYSTYTDFGKLVRQRIGAVAALELTGDYYLRRYHQEFKNIIKLTPPLVEKPYYLMLSHQFVEQHPELAERVWDAIAEIRRTYLQSLAEKYFD